MDAVTQDVAVDLVAASPFFLDAVAITIVVVLDLSFSRLITIKV